MGNLFSCFPRPARPRTAPVHLTAEAILNKPLEQFDTEEFGTATWKTLLSADKTPSNGLTAGIATCARGSGRLAHHRHAHAEIYVIMQGQGIADVAGRENPVSKGDVLYIPGDAEHGIRNPSPDEDLVWFYCFAADSFQEIKYRFSRT